MPLLLAAAFGIGTGILCESVLYGGMYACLFAAFVSAASGAAYAWKKRRTYILCALFFLCIVIGILRFLPTEKPLNGIFTADVRSRASYDGVVLANPEIRERNIRVPVRIRKDTARVTVLVVAKEAETLAAGDQVRVNGTLSVPQPFASDGGRVFHYDSYLRAQGISFLLEYASIRKTGDAPWFSLRALFGHVKNAFMEGVDRALPEPYASLANGLTIGGKNGLGKALEADFIRSGLVQIIVLSGYNVMIVAEWMMTFLSFTPLPKRIAPIAGALAIAFFVGVAGAQATAVRAGLMALIALFARATNRTYDALRALIVAVLCMLLFNPLYLSADPGFSLSVCATAGLILFSPYLERKLSWIRNTPFRVSLATTLAAQLSVLPLLLYQTGNLSLAAIPANLLVMSFIPAAMAFSALAGFSGMAFGAASVSVPIIIGFPAYALTAFIIATARFFSKLPGASVILPAFPFWLVIIAYGLLALFFLFIKDNSTAFRHAS